MTKENAEKSKELLRKISLYEKELDKVMNTHSISVEPFQKSSVIVSKPLQIQIRVLLISEYELILEELNKKLDELCRLLKEDLRDEQVLVWFRFNAELLAAVTAIKNYPVDQIYTALSYLIDDDNEFITDILGRLGHLVYIGDYYMF